MIVSKYFSKIPWLYYLLLLAANVGVVVMALFMPQHFAEKHYEPVYGYSAGIGVLFALIGFLIADVKGGKLVPSIVAPVVCGVVSAITVYVIFYRLVHLTIGIDRVVSLRMGQVFLFLELGVLDALLLLFSARFFGIGKGFSTALAVLLVLVTMGLAVLPFAGSFAKTYLRKYDFLTEPAVYVNGSDGYSILFATTTAGTGEVTIQKEGVTTVYKEQKIGVTLYDRIVHRVDVPKSALEGGTYYVSSRQTRDGSDKVWVMGKEIKSKTYAFRAYAGTGDVSFLCVSDNQGTSAPTQRAVKAAADANEYDFVLMLGDHAESYNDIEEDVVGSLLKVSAIASKSVLPVYYTLGNHEYRGMLASYLWDLIPTGSDTGEAYYTFTMGDAFFSVINFANDHDDDFERFAGLADFNAYKDKEFEWYEQAMQSKPYEGKMHVVLSHIPMVYEDNLTAYEHECEDCHKVHDYKYREFGDLFKACDVAYIVSGHSHVPPAEFKSDKYDYKNLHAGSNYANKSGFRNSIVTLSGGQASFKIYGE